MTWSNPTKSPIPLRTDQICQAVGELEPEPPIIPKSWFPVSIHLGDNELLRILPNSGAAFWDRWKNHWPDLTSLFIWFWHQVYFSNWKVFESTLYDRPNAVINNCYRYVLGAGPLRITGILWRISAFLMVFPVSFTQSSSPDWKVEAGVLVCASQCWQHLLSGRKPLSSRLGNPWTKHQRSTYLLGAWRTQGPKTNIDFPERRCHSEPWDLQLQPDPSSCMSVSNEDGSKPMIFK